MLAVALIVEVQSLPKFETLYYVTQERITQHVSGGLFLQVCGCLYKVYGNTDF